MRSKTAAMPDASPRQEGRDVVYTLKPAKAGRATFSDVRLPDGTTIRRVDESVHRRALSNVSRAFKEKAS